MAMAEDKTGHIEIKMVEGRSTVTSLYARFPLKFIHPRKAVSSEVDAVWIYSVSFGGGILSGDSISYTVTVGDGCTAVLATQASTKVYKAAAGECSEQLLEAWVGSNSLLAILADPVTCFSSARYLQRQVLNVVSDSNLIIVDWLTSGRYKRGEVWDFERYKSTNNIYLNGNQPLFLDTILLEQGICHSVADRMQDFNVQAMLVIFGPKFDETRSIIMKKVKDKNSISSCGGVYSKCLHPKKAKCMMGNQELKLDVFASCSMFGRMDSGLVVRILAYSTEGVYKFLREHLSSIQPLIGTFPYAGGYSFS